MSKIFCCKMSQILKRKRVKMSIICKKYLNQTKNNCFWKFGIFLFQYTRFLIRFRVNPKYIDCRQLTSVSDVFTFLNEHFLVFPWENKELLALFCYPHFSGGTLKNESNSVELLLDFNWTLSVHFYITFYFSTILTFLLFLSIKQFK